MSDRRCIKCEMRLDRSGFVVREHPARIPELNPVSGLPNKQYGTARAERADTHATSHNRARRLGRASVR